MDGTRNPARKWIVILGSILVVFLVAVGTIAWHARHMDNRIRIWVVRALSERFKSRVELAKLTVNGFPNLGVTGEDLTIQFDGREDLPPLIHADRIRFSLNAWAILRLPRHISSAQIENMTITLPPRGEKKPPKPEQPEKKTSNLVSALIVDRVVCKNTVLITLPRKPEPGKPAKEPLEWDIHDLDLHSASIEEPFLFHGTLTNAKPKGEIHTDGKFGPWDVDDPGYTPVSGTYEFTNADLGPFPGIAGILSSTGNYSGQLSELQVKGETDTPDFSLDKIGKPVPLHTEYSATVDGTNGDTLLHPVRATLVRSVIIAEGSVINEPHHVGHMIVLNVGAPNARIQDILSLAMNSDTPFLSGPAKIKAKLILPPGKQKVLEKMILDGQIGIDDAQWSSEEVREKLESLSRHGEGKPSDEDAGSAVSDLRGKFHLEKGVIRFSSLTFSVPGASIDLVGSYKIQGGDIDFNGHLRLQAKLSQTVTGAKSFFLKALDPFFAKDGAGTVVPISITGTREHPTVGVTVFHKKIERKVGGDTKSSGK